MAEPSLADYGFDAIVVVALPYCVVLLSAIAIAIAIVPSVHRQRGRAKIKKQK